MKKGLTELVRTTKIRTDTERSTNPLGRFHNS